MATYEVTMTWEGWYRVEVEADSEAEAAKAADKKRAARKAAEAPGERARSPIQALKASVKQAAARNGKGKSKKNRR